MQRPQKEMEQKVCKITQIFYHVFFHQRITNLKPGKHQAFAVVPVQKRTNEKPAKNQPRYIYCSYKKQRINNINNII